MRQRSVHLLDPEQIDRAICGHRAVAEGTESEAKFLKSPLVCRRCKNVIICRNRRRASASEKA